MAYKIENDNSYTSQMANLVAMMDYARSTTLEAVEGLTMEELDYIPHEEANSIGSLLFHIAAIEKGFQIELFDGRRPNQEEMVEWGAAYSLGNQGRSEIRGHSLDFYLDKLTEVRARTLEEFKVRNDEWLYEDCLWDGHKSNHYFIWFHVFEDEINHRGQIRMTRKMLRAKV
ncbi:DinB family protein [Halobacillus sp. BBL2006]|uniref:DinB family protein n=1 Tax=Halobacillus sp. BBL2006 TaxID=1543706 RepID=UPI0005423695|nr:DinB family protein [Halobacillus sp. BBL2006]KHE67806.1 hypothetical protein LD39_16015 [Halobacillus sp. BBL2006]